MQEVERGYTQIALIGYFQLSDIAASMTASCFTTSDYDKSRYYTYMERILQLRKAILIHAEHDDDD